MKQNSTIVIVPSSAIETIQLRGFEGLTARTMGLGQERAIKERESQARTNDVSAAAADSEVSPVTLSQPVPQTNNGYSR